METPNISEKLCQKYWDEPTQSLASQMRIEVVLNKYQCILILACSVIFNLSDFVFININKNGRMML